MKKLHFLSNKDNVIGHFSYFYLKNHDHIFFGLNRFRACFIVTLCVVFDELG